MKLTLTQVFISFDAFCEKVIKFTYKGILTILLGTIIWGSSQYYYESYMTQEAIQSHVRDIYSKLLTETGQSQDSLPLKIIDDVEENAYNTGQEIVINTGLIQKSSYHEIAWVLGHEIAHGMLGHLGSLSARDDITQWQVNEANADKMGAVYMMKAGYDICKGRKILKRWTEKNGNYLGDQHPDYSYRYDELNINCD